MPERMSSRLRIGWAAARAGRELWSDGLALPEGFLFNVYHQARMWKGLGLGLGFGFGLGLRLGCTAWHVV